MREKLVVVADLGRMRTYRWQESPNFSKPRLELLDDWETQVTNHLSEELTDQAGQYRRGHANTEGATAMSDGEQHNLDLERRRRAVKGLAQRISELLAREKIEGCYLAADNRISQPLLDEMDPRTRAQIEKTVTSNLSKLDQDAIIQHFSE